MSDENLSPAALDGLDPESQRRLRRWWSEPAYAAAKPELAALVRRVTAGDAEARADLADAFSRDLPIGTGGRRGPVGPGPNRMNAVVLRQTAAGVARFVRDRDAGDAVVVVYDTRRDSRAFAHLVARALSADGLPVVVLDAPRPTPQLSFEMRRRAAGAGIVISASHNPPGDNGIKIYASDGAQVLGRDDADLMTAIEAAADAELPPLSDAPIESLERVEMISGDALARLDADYHRYVLDQGVLSGSLADAGLRVVYTPLHGVGGSAVLPVLRAREVEVSVVEAQMDPDGGRFSTVRSANPESPDAFAMARALAEQVGARLAVANDPDADRLGALARNGDGELEFIDGNRLGALLADHVLRHAALPPEGYLCQTLVSSPMVASLARDAGVDVVDDILVGFKHHAGIAREREGRPLVFGYEESHGYLRGSEIRDKDGAIGTLLLVECAVDCARNGQTLFDRLADLWSRTGYHCERTRNIWARGAIGREAIAEVMKQWRVSPPREIAGLTVTDLVDRSQPRQTGSETRDLPGNVLVHELGGAEFACRLVLRPSGTEPKLKVYALARGPRGGGRADEVDALVERVLEDAQGRADAIMRPLLSDR